ncbi:hypothetical protein HDE_01092 [Halotydeus destructor]|nr:hypothetical protein HDE_01092 [Halotydeus destructor]
MHRSTRSSRAELNDRIFDGVKFSPVRQTEIENEQREDVHDVEKDQEVDQINGGQTGDEEYVDEDEDDDAESYQQEEQRSDGDQSSDVEAIEPSQKRMKKAGGRPVEKEQFDKDTF